MKANELMIGDWVRRRYIKKPSGQEVVSDFRVAQIRRLFIDDEPDVWGDNGNMGTAEQMEPIPLTPEILEKNGFVFNYTPYMKWTQFGLVIHKIYGYYCIDCGINVNIDVRSVHLLQHVLRLCGIDKDIVL